MGFEAKNILNHCFRGKVFYLKKKKFIFRDNPEFVMKVHFYFGNILYGIFFTIKYYYTFSL